MDGRRLIPRSVFACLAVSMAMSCIQGPDTLSYLAGERFQCESNCEVGEMPDRYRAAMKLVGAATAKARAGDCAITIAVVAHLRDLHSTVHASFLHNAAVASCLKAAAARHLKCQHARDAWFAHSMKIVDAEERLKTLPSPRCFDPSTLTTESLTDIELQRAIDRAWAQIDHAATAGIRGDCNTVRSTLDGNIRDPLLGAFTAMMIKRDPANAVCLKPLVDAERLADEKKLDEQIRIANEVRRGSREPCLNLRATRLREANKLTNPNIRGKYLRSIPHCDEPNAFERMPAAPTDPSLPSRMPLVNHHGPVKDFAFAWQLTWAARAWAATGDCSIALKNGPEVKRIDANFHVAVFMRIDTIARCDKTSDTR